MKAYFNKNFWYRGEEGVPGIPEKANWKFVYDNQEYFIPMLYKFPEGITLDIINIHDTEKLKIFYEKYRYIENDMTEEELLLAEQESPVSEFPLGEVYINNEPTKRENSCSANYMAFADNGGNDEVLNEIKEEYGINDEVSFGCTRVHAEYLNEAQKEINNLKFITSKTEDFLPVIMHFTVKKGVPYDIEFRHPLTGVEHHIYINDVEYKNAKLIFPRYDQEEPYNFACIWYELIPPLPQDERLSIREIKQHDEGSGIRKNKSACSIGVISGRGGETTGRHGYPLDYICTEMYWKALSYIELSIAGIYKIRSTEKELTVYSDR